MGTFGSILFIILMIGSLLTAISDRNKSSRDNRNMDEFRKKNKKIKLNQGKNLNMASPSENQKLLKDYSNRKMKNYYAAKNIEKFARRSKILNMNNAESSELPHQEQLYKEIIRKASDKQYAYDNSSELAQLSNYYLIHYDYNLPIQKVISIDYK